MVHIKKIDIFGFKSFGARNTSVLLRPGMVSFSGPNGSGKSNILDAVIFTLGENRPKMMRVGRLLGLLHDVDGQKKTGVARCSVHFDNADRKIPVDSDRVKVTRELSESGENTYYLNDRKIQRGQMLNLLDVANAGLNPLNVIQQGTVTRISEFSQEEKREAIEDLVGLAYFDEKKEAAQKQLEAADRRLEVALAKMGEIKRRIDELEEERNAKLRYDMLGAEIRRLDAISAANELASVAAASLEKENQRKQAASRAADLSRSREDIQEGIVALESKKTEVMESADAYNKESAALEGRITQAITMHEGADARLKTSENRIPKIEARLEQIDRSRDEIRQERTSGAKSKETIREAIAGCEADARAVSRDMAGAEEWWGRALQRQASLGREKSGIDKKAGRMRRELESALTARSETRSRRQEALERIGSHSRRITALRDVAAEQEALMGRAEKVLAARTGEAEREGRAVGSLAPKVKRTRREIEEAARILEKAEKVAARIDGQIKAIKSVMHEDYSIAILKRNGKKLGVIGLAYEIMSWDGRYERAVLAAGSDWIKAVVVRDLETLLGLAEYARLNGLPKTRMIPCEGAPPQRRRMVRGRGILGRLADRVKCAPEYEGVREFIFGETILTENGRLARRVSGEGIRAVTLDGELFEARTAAAIVDVGSKISKLTRLISMSGSVDDLLRSISLLRGYSDRRKESLKGTDAELEGHRTRLAAAQRRAEAAGQTRADLESAVSRSKKTIIHLESRLEALRRSSAALHAREVLRDSRVASLEQRIAILERMHDPREQERVGVELERLGRVKSELDGRRADLDGALGKSRTRIAMIDSQEAQGSRMEIRLEEERRDLESEAASLRDDMASLRDQRDESHRTLVGLREKQQDILKTGGGSIERLASYDSRIRHLNVQERKLTDGINSAKRRMDSLTRDIDGLGVRASKLRYLAGLSKPEIKPDALGTLLAALKAERDGLEPRLNAAAVGAYRSVSEGYRSMSERKNALESERNSIVKFIEDVERDKRQTFLDAFDRVDREIRAIFSDMTGGSAWLELQNEDDIFSSGVSYMVQFPRKSKRESTSLSGGEKSLAAVTFVLALQKLKPSPFYLFDEVDAALDAQNAEQLSRILGERSQNSQFIVVSLKDFIVNKAGLIYGVYPRGGVSHLIEYKDRRAAS